MFTQRLAQFVADTKIEEIPHNVLDAARHAITDTMGCAIAGALEEVSELAVAWVTDIGARAQATVWGRELASSAAEAAFANGVASHALDFDDSLPSLRGHPSATIVPAALAIAEVTKSSGKSVLAAYALGLEVAGKIGRALGQGHYMRGWHITATVGVFSAAAAAGRLWGLSAKEMQVAWGIAGSETSGLIRNFGTMTKPLHAGHAARSGVLAAWMARRGFTANESIFEGDDGLFAVYGTGDGEPLAALLSSLGRPWELLDPGIYVKRWPCCYCNHRPIGGMLRLVAEHNIQPAEVEAVEIGFLPGSDTALVSSDPQTGLEGKFSIEYVAAATLLDGKLKLETFTDPMVQRPAIRTFMPKIRRYRIEDKGVYSGIVGYTDVAILTTRGRFATRVEHTPGSPAWPMTEPDRVDKFLDSAGRVLGEQGAKQLLDSLDALEKLADITPLIKATVTRPSSQRQRAGMPH